MVRTIYEVLFRLLVLIHVVFILGNILSVFVLPLATPWYISIPMLSFITNLMFNNAFKQCPLTQLENYLRELTGRRLIRSFVGHYFFLPMRKFFRKIRLRPV